MRMLRQYGIPRFYNLLRQWGMTTLDRPPERLRADPRSWAEPRATLVRDRRRSTPSWPSWRRAPPGGGAARSGLLRRRAAGRPSQMSELGPAAAYLTLEALTAVNRPDEEGFWRQFSSSKWVAWKTGTSFGLRDAWAVGVTPAYTVGVWAGNADGEGKPGLTGPRRRGPGAVRPPAARWTAAARIRPPAVWLQEYPGLPRFGLSGRRTSARPTTVTVPAREPLRPGCAASTRLVHLDAARALPGRQPAANRSARMRHEPWFVLPPVPGVLLPGRARRLPAPCRRCATRLRRPAAGERRVAGS
ncbi:MAG: hypothetical protein MZV64_33815 [Ignavibacteriales bacterium]|nr:hypothetical protein [Ignavibacteriales bacterium]